MAGYITYRELEIARIVAKKNQISDSLLIINNQYKDLKHSYGSDYRFNGLLCSPKYNQFVKAGDSLEIIVGLFAQNYDFDINKPKAYVTLGKSIDSITGELTEVYDTIDAVNWTSHFKIKTNHKTGIDSIFGALNVPIDGKISDYIFTFQYVKVDENTYKSLKKFQKPVDK